MATVKLSVPNQISTFRIPPVTKSKLTLILDDSDDDDDVEDDEDEECSSTFEMTLPMKTMSSTTTISRKNSEEDSCHYEEDLYNIRKSLADTDTDLSHYEQMCTLGTGTFGRVYLMRFKETEEYFALKVMPIRDIVRSKQIDHVHNEKQILESLQHPFIVRMHWAFHDQKCLFMLFDYIAGGELFSYLRFERHFTDETAKFYASEIVLALEYLHSKNIVYRDLKPENLLLDTDGHVVITDFGFAKVLKDTRTWTLCGTPEYLAPEVIEGKGHNTAVDWWSLGILIFEMISGAPPFSANNTLQIYEKIIENQPKFSEDFSEAAKDIVQKLLMIDRTKRLGNMKGKAKDIKNHVWFDDINWQDVYERRSEPPILPKVDYEGDSGNFDEYDEIELKNIKDANEDELNFFVDW
jgi:protein kinase X